MTQGIGSNSEHNMPNAALWMHGTIITQPVLTATARSLGNTGEVRHWLSSPRNSPTSGSHQHHI